MHLMALHFMTLLNNYPTEKEYSHNELFDAIGWGDLKANPAYLNTCAIRMSLCLLRSGVRFPGRMAIKAGPFKGAKIEPGQVRLTNILAMPHILGAPVKLTRENRDEGLKGKQGLVAFMRIPGYTIDGALSGHLDLVQHGTFLYFFQTLDCADHCYWSAAEYWFWALP